LCAALLGALPAAASDAQVAVRRFALVVGSNDGGPDRVRLQYAHTDAQALAGVLMELGGVAPEDTQLLFEPKPAQLAAALASVAEGIDEARADGRTELIVYFSGHSDEEGLLLGGDRYAYRDLRAALRALPVDVRVGILDSCASGAMTRAKGGKLRPPFLVDESTEVSGHAFLTSSSATEAAQESDSIGASFFTHYLISGLRGAADTTGDGRVTLNEAYQFAFGETLARTEKTRSGAQHPSYDIQLAGTGDLVLTDLRVTSAGLVLEEALAGRLFVHDTGDRLVAELSKSPGRRVEIGLAAGDYRLTLRQDDLVLETQVTVAGGARAAVSAGRFNQVDVEPTVARGEAPGVQAEATAERRSLHLTILPRLKPPDPVHTSLSIGLITSAATAVDGLSLALLANSIEQDASGVQLTLGANVVGENAGGFVGAVGGNIIGGRAKALAWASGFNITGGDHELGQIAYGFNIAGGLVRGIQGAAGFNIAGDNLHGVQAAAGFNIAGAEVEGVQAAAGFNIAGDNLHGVQAAAGFNIAGGNLHGVQAAAGFNVAEDVSGAQIGVVNVAGQVSGLQLGIINVSEDIEGLPIGLINWVENGQRHIAYWTSAQELANLEFRFGSRHVYTLVMAGFSSPEEAKRWYAAFGIGGTVNLDPFYLNFDISAGMSRKGWKLESVRNVRTQARVFLVWELLGRLGVFAGASLNAFAGFNGEEIEISGAPQAVWSNGDAVWRMWPSVFLGVQI
jgi:hypothetical protein